MFGGASNNPYDDIVVKTTDEHLTSENWELILNLCDKVQDEGPEGAHNVVASLLKRLTHRNPNVQLYALSLAEALSKNCSIELHRELASRAWTAGLERVITDRNTHEKVRTRALGLVAQWTSEFADDSTLGIMQECYDSLKAKNYKYTRPDTPPPPAVDDAIRRREEEELQRVLEMSVRDRGGRQPYAYENSFSGGGGSSTSTYGNVDAGGSAPGNGAGGASSGAYGGGSSSDAGGSGYASGYTPAQPTRERTPSPTNVPSSTGPDPSAAAIPEGAIVTRVRALHPFTPTEAGELGFEKGDVIKVVDRGYRDWWRGQLRGRTGIFPVNYVEPLPEPTPVELAAEATQEAAVFAQAVNVERLLNMLRALDPSKGDNLADDEEIQELYRSCMALRPKIVKLIDKYSQKRADLVSMNETFVRARTIFDRMMEESLARHSGGVYGPYAQQQAPYGPAAAAGGPAYFPTAAAAGYPDAAAYQYAQQQQQGQASGQQQPGYEAQPGYGAYGPQGPTPYPAQGQPQPAGYPAQAPGQPQAQSQAQGPTPYPAQAQQAQGVAPYAAQQQPAPQPQPTAQAQPQPAQQQPVQVQAQAQQPDPQPQQAQQAQQAQQQQQQQQVTQAGPPYIYDPHTTYADPNVQAWAQYYAAGGKDLAGSVYFVSIPGITDAAPAPAPAAQPLQAQDGAQSQVQGQAQGQAQGHVGGGAQPVQGGIVQQAQSQGAVVQLQDNTLSPTSPIDDDPGYFPDPYANQPEYATPVQQTQPTPFQQQEYHNPHPQPTSPGSELAHALGPQPAQPQYQGYSLTDPGSGSASAAAPQQQQRQGYTLTDPGSGSVAGAAPSSPVAAYGASAAYGLPASSLSGHVGGSPELAAAPASSTPSWVLPKKSPNPNTRGAGSPQPGGAGLTGQFAGMHV